VSRNKHIHRFTKVNIGKKKDYVVFKCNKPECSYYIPYVLAKNRACECNRCAELMLLDARSMKLKKPHCLNCVERKEKDLHDKLKEFLELNDPSLISQE